MPAVCPNCTGLEAGYRPEAYINITSSDGIFSFSCFNDPQGMVS